MLSTKFDGIQFRIHINDSYIGHTKRRLHIRVDEHEDDYNNRFKPTGKTALMRHSLKMEKELKREH